MALSRMHGLRLLGATNLPGDADRELLDALGEVATQALADVAAITPPAGARSDWATVAENALTNLEAAAAAGVHVDVHTAHGAIWRLVRDPARG